MSDIKMATTQMKPAELISTAKNHIALCAPAPPKEPPIPDMATPVADLQALLTPADNANNAYEAAKNALPGLLTARDTTAAALGVGLVLFGKSAVAAAKGKAEMLQLGGFTVATATHSPAPGVSQLENLSLNEGKMPGSLAAKCKPDANAKTYEWQTTGDPVTGPYVTFKTTTAARVTITGLTSGSRVWVRVRAIGTKGIEGPWSDPAMKIVP